MANHANSDTLEQRIDHAGHPDLRWMMDDIYVRTDPAGNIKPNKEKSTEQIDGAVATIREKACMTCEGYCLSNFIVHYPWFSAYTLESFMQIIPLSY